MAGEMSLTIGEIAGALARAQASLGKLIAGIKVEVQTKKGRDYTYTYANLADALEACCATLNGEGIAIIQMPATPEKNGVNVTTMLAHSSGEWIRSEPLFMPVSGGAQDVGSAITYGRRYQLLAMVGLAPEDDDDGAAAQNAKPERWEDAKPRLPDLGQRCTGKAAPIATASKGYVEALAAHADTDPAKVWAWALRESGIDCSKYVHEVPVSAELTTADGLVVKAVLKLEAGRKGVDDAGPDGGS